MKYQFEKYIMGLLRIVLGWIYFWAFLDKVFGLGFATEAGKSWLDGTSPTFGFLKFGSTGPLAPLYQSIAGNVIIDWLFMLGLLGIGLALILGIGIQIAGWSGALLMLMMYSAVLLPEHNPLFDEHIVYLLVLISFTYVPVGHWLGFGHRWSQTSLVKKYPWLQ